MAVAANFLQTDPSVVAVPAKPRRRKRAAPGSARGSSMPDPMALFVGVEITDKRLSARWTSLISDARCNLPNTPEGVNELHRWALALQAGATPVYAIESSGGHHFLAVAILEALGARIVLKLRAYVGVDVSKDTLDACWSGPNGDKYLKVPNTGRGIDQLHAWAKSFGAGYVPVYVMESTGSYHQLAALVLRDLGDRVSVVNPMRPRKYAGASSELQKTDKMDARVLSLFGAACTPREWSPPPNELLELRALVGRFTDVVSHTKRENLRLKENPRVVVWLAVARSIRRSIKQLLIERKELRAEIETFYEAHTDLSEARDLLMTIKGVGVQAADLLLCLIHGRGLTSAAEAAALAGVIPIHRESGTSVRGKPRMSREGSRLIRSGLYMPAQSAIQYNERVKAFYEARLAAGLSKKAAVIAVIHLMIRIAFAILKTKRPYDPAYLERCAAANDDVIALAA